MKRKYYMCSQFQQGSDASWIRIERNDPRSELAIYLGYFGAGSDRSRFVESLVNLSISPRKVPWKIGAAAADLSPAAK